MAADIIDLKDRMKNTVDKKTVAVKVQDLKEAYALISPLTNLPYVECEQENFFDQVLLYETKEDAEAAAKVYGEKGIRVLVRDLKTLELELPVKPEEPDGEKRKVFLNQVRQHLGILPFMGVNAVCYKAADAPAELIEKSGSECPVSAEPSADWRISYAGSKKRQRCRRSESAS